MVAQSGQAGRPQSSHSQKVRRPQRLQGRKKPPSGRFLPRIVITRRSSGSKVEVRDAGMSRLCPGSATRELRMPAATDPKPTS